MEPVYAALKQLPNDLKPKTIIAAMRFALKPGMEAARTVAPVARKTIKVKRYKGKSEYYMRQPGTLRDSIILHNAPKPWPDTVYVSIKTKYSKDISKNPWYAHFLTLPAKQVKTRRPFLEAGWKSVANNIPAQMAIQINKIINAWARKNGKVITP